MAKPATKPRWADTASGLANQVTPPSGKLDIGWAVQEKPPSTFFNWLFYWIYKWILYLDTITSEVLTWTAAQTWSALGTFSNGLTVSGGTTNLLTTNTGALGSSSTITASGAVTGSDLKHTGTQSLGVSAFEAVWDGTNWTRDGSNSGGFVTATAGSPGDVLVPLKLKQGDSVSAIRARLSHSTGTASSMSITLLQVIQTTGAVTFGTTVNSGAVTTIQSLAIGSGLPATVGGDDAWFLRISSSATAMTRKIYGVEVDFTRP